MHTLEEMNMIIYEMRQSLYIIIDEKRNLLDEEVIAISQKLDDILNKYNKLLTRKN
jgi:Spo0E like sporulation regulatory protein.